MKKPDKKYYNNPEKYIPKGFYCYGNDGICPFWDIDESKPYQENGYCHYLEEGDWMEDGTFILWDQVKECEINRYTEEELEDLFNDSCEGE